MLKEALDGPEEPAREEDADETEGAALLVEGVPDPLEVLALAELPPLFASQTFELSILMVRPVGLLPLHVPPLSSVNALATHVSEVVYCAVLCRAVTWLRGVVG